MFFISRKRFEQEVQKKADERIDDYFRREEQKERFRCLDRRFDDMEKEIYMLRMKIEGEPMKQAAPHAECTCEAGNYYA